jgi:hypothetical protein
MAVEKEAMQAKNEHASKYVDFFQSKVHKIKRAFFLSPDGKIRFMPCQIIDIGTVWDYKPEGWDCFDLGICPFLVNAWNFIEYLKAPFDLPYGCNHVQVGKWKTLFHVANSLCKP